MSNKDTLELIGMGLLSRSSLRHYESKLKLGKWAALTPHFRTKGPVLVGVSGGRTSAMMAALTVGWGEAFLCFQNTGLEHPGTYDFLKELEGALGQKITWLEYVKPERKGAPPREARFRVVDYKTADRSGGPFEQMMEALAEFREAKGEAPVAPWARSRICTAYLKMRTQDRWERTLGYAKPIPKFAGLRADEPERVERLKKTPISSAPLAAAGITKTDVLAFWKMQSFDLGIREEQGNCTGCFLKDQSDLARVMNEPESLLSVWDRMERRYDSFGGANFMGYAKLASEAPLRSKIESALKAGQTPINDGSMEPRRFHFVVIQERKRLEGKRPSFSCNCEGAETLAALEDE